MPSTDLCAAHRLKIHPDVSFVPPCSILQILALKNVFVPNKRSLNHHETVHDKPRRALNPFANTSIPPSVTAKTVDLPTNAANVKDTTQLSHAKTLENEFYALPQKAPTPVNIENLELELKRYTVHLKVILISALKDGFNIGYKGPEFQSLTKNLKSASSHPGVLFDNILAELKEKRVSGPFAVPPLPNFCTSPIGVVPKKDSPKFRTITDLSSPRGLSVNDFIPDSEAAVQFNHFDEAVKLVAKCRKGALLAKLDIKSAFRICPVRPEDWHLLGFSFEDMYFVDLCLPFGLRSSVNRFSLLADAILWILKNNYLIENTTNYLDDYFLACPGESQKCQEQLTLAISVFAKLGIPLAPEKVVGPKHVITYLGIEIDSLKMELRLPAEKIREISEILVHFRNKKKCTKRELLSLIGKLSFA